MSETLTESGKNLVELAKEVRANATAYRRTVERYCAEMPAHLDAFHAAMMAFRRTAADLSGNRNRGAGTPFPAE